MCVEHCMVKFNLKLYTIVFQTCPNHTT